jgi:hypothetical protein
MSCRDCHHFEGPDSEYPKGSCLFFRNKAGNVSISPVDLSIHGVDGCRHWEARKAPTMADMAPYKDYTEPRDNSEVPF